MNRTNMLYLIIGILIVGVAVLGYKVYQEQHPPEGLHIDVGPNGVNIEKK